MATKTLRPTPIDSIVTMFPQLLPLKGEDVMDLQMVEMSAFDALKNISKAYDCFKINAHGIRPQIANISINELTKMFYLATFKGMATPSPLPIPQSPRHISGLQLHFAVYDGEFTLLYQPIYMKWAQYNGGTHDDRFTVDWKGEMYRYDGSNFMTLTNGDVLKENYRNQVSIKHNDDNSVPNTFSQNHDVESVIFPFQTIFTIIHDNNGDSVELFSSMQKIKYDPIYAIKHCVLLLTDSKSSSFTSLTSKLANRSHLCPPCDGINISYDLE